MKQNLITIAITILIIALPIAIIPNETLYNLPKIWILAIGGITLLILLLVNYKKLKLDTKDYVILAFAVLVFISTMLSSKVKISIIGEINRYEGMIAFYMYILIYFCAKKFLKYKNNKILLNILHAIYIVISILGILQYYIKLPTNALIPIFKKESIFIILSVIISYLAQAFFNISTIGIAPLFWTALGILDNKNFENI